MGGSWRGLWGRRADWSDPTIAGALFVLTTGELLALGTPPESLPWATLAGAASTLPLAWRRRRPLSSHVMVATGAAAIMIVLGHPNVVGPLLAWTFSGYSIGAHRGGFPALAGLAFQVLPVISFAQVQTPGASSFGPVQVLLMLVPWVAGRLVREQRLAAAATAERNRLLEEESVSRSRIAAAEERARLARDVHDLIAHSVSVMVVQAEAADEVLARDPEGTRRSLQSIQETGREALAELRQALAAWRSTEPDPALRGAGLAEVPRLVDQMVGLGLDVELTSEGDPLPLSPAVETAAYRVVREGLTNTLRHAGAATATVRLRFELPWFLVEVADTGHGGMARANGSGHGLVGLRELVELCGGTLDAGPADGGGFVVRARMPVDGPR